MKHRIGKTNGIIRLVNDSLLAEILQAMALPRNQATIEIIRRLFGRAALKFTRLAVELDRRIQRQGVMAGARWVLNHFTTGFEVSGKERIPPKGPLIIASNHPASYDGLVISACIPRPDFKVIISDIPFFRYLPNVRRCAIFTPKPENLAGRMATIRHSIRHLRGGGALLVFPRGGIEPDPAFMPKPDGEFHQWSRSLEIFLKNAPDAQVLVTTVSGVISQKIFHHPVTWLRKRRADKQRLAFIYQMICQALSGKELFGLHPHVTFGELLAGEDHKIRLADIEAAARRTLANHLAFRGI